MPLEHSWWVLSHVGRLSWVVLIAVAAGCIAGFVVGSIVAYVIMRRALSRDARSATEKDPEADFGDEGDAQTIQFLHEKRYAFFKTRQEHEWRVYFAAWVLLGALDAAVVTGELALSGWPVFLLWIPACLAVFAVVWGYQANLQHANKEDRKAMNTLYNRLCGLVGVPKDSPIRARTWSYRGRYRFGWAFPW